MVLGEKVAIRHWEWADIRPLSATRDGQKIPCNREMPFKWRVSVGPIVVRFRCFIGKTFQGEII